ncbi:Sarcalumenin [Lepeophtheirus salmonis]|uniref:Sarcalumenin n=1 Tax=Lepeophtheirus salmonis TaxID=72036 RepID=A0A7R8CYL5_LEPSM|nr:Sarcalumenin [Lepeophtheirus salmonis]CAF2969516.1 Sarcalumenin [Lepeophtheirus salmonis]
MKRRVKIIRLRNWKKEVIKEPKTLHSPLSRKKKTQEGHKTPSKEENNKNKKIKKSKGSTSTIDKVGNKYLLKVGEGGCRGDGWSKGEWPKWYANMDTYTCAKACLNSKECTAIHVLERETLEGETLLECLHYNHKKVITVPRLGGNCYKLVDNLQTKDEGKEDDSETIVSFKKPVEIKHLGKGRCRGYLWQSYDNKWPKVSGHLTLKECSEECARFKGCTSFDITEETSNKKADCLLYSHKDIVPANFQKGSCYGLVDRLHSKEKPLKKTQNHGKKDVNTNIDESDNDYEEDELELDEDATYFHQGHGRCRGPNWTIGRKWPKLKGRRSIQGCANSCQLKKGCTAFDISDGSEADQTYECVLYGHKNPAPASSVPGECYKLEFVTEDDNSDENDDEADDLDEAFSNIGDDVEKIDEGACRGENWQNPSQTWPKVKGILMPEECKNECGNTKGCTAFDLSPLDTTANAEGKFNCYLFGHKDVIAASAVPGNCFIFPDAIPNDEENDDYDKKEFKKLGKGLCRGPNWQDKYWPKVGNLVKEEYECFKQCKERGACTAFDVSPSTTPSKLNCFMFGHGEVIPASSLNGDCYKMKGRSARKRSFKAHSTPQVFKGVCRGENWQSLKGWPVEKSSIVLNADDCSEMCEDMNGCTAFDIRNSSGMKICTYYGHKEVKPAAAVPGECYIFPPKDNISDEKKVVEGQTYIGKGACRGPGWAGKKWPKEIKGKRISLKECAQECWSLKGCTAFDLREHDNEIVCTIFGHKNVIPASAVPGDCYAAPKQNAFKATAEPSEGFNFNIAMYGDSEEELEGTELAAQFAFSSLQKFGQEFLKKLKGKKMPNQLLKKATFAEIPGVLETGSVRKRDRQYPFNDACQWFIDHADLILLVYDYAKLDIGPETEALLDQLKGRETQVRIILNKADEITADELLKIQGSLVWNVSPLMASMEPPKMYAGSFWSRPYKTGAPKKLLKSQEISLLKDIHQAITKQVENRIATARRFAVRVRNHAKMVDCYLNTYYNHKGYLGDKNKISADIIDNPHKYNIYQGLSTMTNISRYDLPDPENYRYFFNLHPLYDFPTLKSTCTFFKGCPINKLDLAIAYEFS